jgi:hypothetical protein
MSAFTNDGENLLINWIFNTSAVTRPTAWYVGLHTGDPGETGASNEVLVAADADYVRQAVTMGAASGGASASTTQVVFTPAVAAGTYTVTHASIWTASTAGTCLIKGALASSRAISNASPLTFEIGEIIAAVD